jgi:hypothetical protein
LWIAVTGSSPVCKCCREKKKSKKYEDYHNATNFCGWRLVIFMPFMSALLPVLFVFDFVSSAELFCFSIQIRFDKVKRFEGYLALKKARGTLNITE